MTEAAPVTLSFRQRFWKRSRKLLKSLLRIYLLVAIVMYALQTRLIFPGHHYQGTPDVQIHPGAGEVRVDLVTSAGVPVAGLFGKPAARRSESAPVPERVPAVLYFYGNAECVAGSTFVSDRFRAMGVACMLVDYSGFGCSGGSPSEQGCYDAGEAAFQWLRAQPDVDPQRIIIVGWSLGGAVAVEIAQRHQHDGVCGLMTFCTFDSLVSYSQRQVMILPTGLLLHHRFLSTSKLPAMKVPYFAAHGKADDVIPFGNLARLTATYGGAKEDLTLFVSDTARHNDFFDAAGPDLEKAAKQWLDRVTGR